MLFNFLQRTAPTFATAPQSKARSVRAIAGDVEDPWFDKYVLTRYTSLSNANADTSGTVVDDGDTINLVDNEDLISGTDYWYRLSYIDIYGNMSAKSSPPSSIIYRGATTDDIEDEAVTPRKANLGNLNNKVKDNQLIDPTLWQASGGAGPAITSFPNDAGLLGASTNFFRVTSSLAIGQSLTFKSLPINPCVPEVLLSFSCYVKRFAPASTYVVTLSVEYYTIDASGETVFLSDSVASDSVSLLTSVVFLKFNEVAPAGAMFFAFKIVTAAAASATTYGFDIGGPSAVQAVQSVNEWSENSSSITVPASSNAVIMTHVSNHTSQATTVRISFQFKHNSGASRLPDFQINRNGAFLESISAMRLDDLDLFNYEFLDQTVSGVSSTYELIMFTPGNSVTVIHRTAMSQAAFG